MIWDMEQENIKLKRKRTTNGTRAKLENNYELWANSGKHAKNNANARNRGDGRRGGVGGKG